MSEGLFFVSNTCKSFNDSVWVEKEFTMAIKELGYNQIMVYPSNEITFEPRRVYKNIINNKKVIHLNNEIELLGDELLAMIENGDLVANE